VGDIPEVLFMCTHNAGRSQMAAALLAREAGGAVRVTSAGSEPTGQVNPAVAAAMAEIGVDITREIPKPLGAGQAEAADIVITMGCGDACAVFPGKRYLVWELPDPLPGTDDPERLPGWPAWTSRRRARSSVRGQPVALSQRTGAPSPARRNGSSS
jgi:arsenate reductase (thioredoxin)